MKSLLESLKEISFRVLAWTLVLVFSTYLIDIAVENDDLRYALLIIPLFIITFTIIDMILKKNTSKNKT